MYIYSTYFCNIEYSIFTYFDSGGKSSPNGSAKIPDSSTNEKEDVDESPPPHKPKLAFHCQQAHGSPTGIITGFTNVKELYQKIAECYDFPPSDVRKHNYSTILIKKNCHTIITKKIF